MKFPLESHRSGRFDLIHIIFVQTQSNGEKNPGNVFNTLEIFDYWCVVGSHTLVRTNQFMHTNYGHFREDIFMAREVTLADIKFEQASVLYNIGALHSILGSMETRTIADVKFNTIFFLKS